MYSTRQYSNSAADKCAQQYTDGLVTNGLLTVNHAGRSVLAEPSMHTFALRGCDTELGHDLVSIVLVSSTLLLWVVLIC